MVTCTSYLRVNLGDETESNPKILTTPYDPQESFEYCAYAIAAYCVESKLSAWDCTTCRQYPYLTDINVFRNKPQETQGYVAYQNKTNQIIAVFRGTVPWSIKDWLHDIDTVKTDYSGCNECKVHKGFYHTYLGLQPQFWEAYKQIRAKYPNASLAVTGHSLGGALALLCAADLIQNGINGFTLYSYGQPRVGNKNFANWFHATFKNTYLRVTHHRDPVPHLPPESFGFRHTPQEIFYNEANSKYQVCSATNGEDPDCSDKYLLEDNVIDHLTYMAYDISYDVLACQ